MYNEHISFTFTRLNYLSREVKKKGNIQFENAQVEIETENDTQQKKKQNFNAKLNVTRKIKNCEHTVQHMNFFYFSLF